MLSSSSAETLTIDAKITTFIQSVKQSDNAQTWTQFFFPIKTDTDACFVKLDLTPLKKNSPYQFLDRLHITLNNQQRVHATVIGIYQDTLYINVDSAHEATPLENYSSQPDVTIEVNEGDETGYQSIAEFNQLYLGFYLRTYNLWQVNKNKAIEKQSSFFFEPKGFRFFKENLAWNDCYLTNTRNLLEIIEPDFKNLEQLIMLLQHRATLRDLPARLGL